ncbi:MAG: hypothetical protein EZS28_008493 [Streblomastix strix]|uniref:RRM domain-containing protein n=1 Tax=Streblomastix strix TaxID=222440 RepID=A0A5J4U0V4_9EUKA|nr:MAG: hypothetical protein EZS28_040683 [Streblomastix strix]KAA6395978.1 MAG: hypothetical protein EZS28_008493 [Streblomastix strix]
MDRRTLYVGGLDQAVDRNVLQNVFSSFGELIGIHYPNSTDQEEQHRGFAFIEFENADDAKEAMFNLNGSVLYNSVLHVNLSRASGNLVYSENQYKRPTFEQEGETEMEIAQFSNSEQNK